MPPNPAQQWLDSRSWESCVTLAKLSAFANIVTDMTANPQLWLNFYNAPDPYSFSLHGEWSKITG